MHRYCLECGYYGKPYTYYAKNISRKYGRFEKCHQCGSISVQDDRPKDHKVLTYEEWKNVEFREKYNNK